MENDVVVVGLGNPGFRYENSLHNVGFKVVERLAAKRKWPWKEEGRHQALIAKGDEGGFTYHLLKPLTFMNLSGEAVRSYLSWTKLPVESLIIVVDDADLPLGTVRVRDSGGDGGHNGLKSVKHELGTDQYKRVRIGIGRDPILPLADFVLKHQDETFWSSFNPALDQAVNVIEEMKFNGVKK